MKTHYEFKFAATGVSFAMRHAQVGLATAMLFANPITVVEAADEGTTGQLDEIVVSARHVSESALTIPESITSLNSVTLEKLDIQSFDDYATKIPNLSFQYGTTSVGFGGTRTLAIRGIASSSILGSTTTGFYIDDTPVPVTVDPQVVDLQRIEVLKGPQGTLYGAGSLGGNVRIVTQQPSFSDGYAYTASAGYTDHASTPDGRTTGVANYTLIDNVAALRAVAFVDHEGGFITRDFPASSGSATLASEGNQGATVTYGGSLTSLVRFDERLSATVRFMGQDTEGHGWGAQYAPLPLFEPSGYIEHRQADVQELWSDKWYLPSVDLVYDGPVWNITASTSYFDERIFNLEDGTEPTVGLVDLYAGFVPNPGNVGLPWSDYVYNNQFNEEIRAAWTGVGPLRGIVGTRYANSHSSNEIPPVMVPGLAAAGAWPTDLVWTQRYNTGLMDRSIFGELYYKFSDFELTLGARKFWLRNSSSSVQNGFLNAGFTQQPLLFSSQSGASPKVALSYEPLKDMLVYASASEGFRAGGPNIPIASNCDPGQIGLNPAEIKNYTSDNLWNYEVGAKGRVGRLALTGAVFDMEWSNIQQQVTLPGCFLPVTVNAGKARVRGAEFEASGRLTETVDVRLGLGYQDPKLTDAGSSGLLAGSRVLQVPDFTGSLAVTYSRPITSTLNGFLSADYSYTGDSYSEITLDIDGDSGVIHRGGFGIFNARTGLTSARYTLEFYAKNLTNKEANLGELATVSYLQFDSHGQTIPRVAVLPPLQLGLQIKKSF
jgi:outer membrane receptor protein involved in Fe transport